MKRITIILFATLLVFAACKKEEETTPDSTTTTNTTTYKGSYNINYNGENFNVLRNSVMLNYDSEDKQKTLAIYGKKSDDTEMTILVTNIGEVGNIRDLSQPNDSCYVYYYEGYNVKFISASGTVKRVSETQVEINASDANSVSLTGTANIGIFN